MHVHEALARALRDFGVTHLFGLIGDGNLHFADSFARHCGGRYISLAHEASAVLAAYGYAQTSGAVGVATVTHGPGLTNTLTALTETARARVPVVVVAGAVSAQDAEHPQRADQRRFAEATGAEYTSVDDPRSAAAVLVEALRRAERTAGPVVVAVPADFMWDEVEYEEIAGAVPEAPVLPDEDEVEAAVAALASALRPVVLIGRGAMSPDASSAALRLARRLGAPIATTLKAKGTHFSEPEHIGVFGTLATPAASGVIADADCVIVLGASLHRRTTMDGALLSGKKVIRVDVSAAALQAGAAGAVSVRADAAEFAEAAMRLLDEAEIAPSGFQAGRSPTPPVVFDHVGEHAPVAINWALTRLDESFDRGRTLVLDAGLFFGGAAALLHVERARAYVHTLDFGSIGLATATAIGAGLGAPEHPVLLVVGDGGFMLGGLADFNAAVRHGVDLTVVVVNDGAYGAEHIQFSRRGADPGISMFDWPDFAEVARALGGDAVHVRTPADLEAALEPIRHRPRPLLIDIRTSPEAVRAARVELGR